MRIPVLEKDETWDKHSEKLTEEVVELLTEIDYIDRDLFEKIGYECIAEEALDVIQVCIGILDKLEQLSPGTIDRKIEEHLTKLIERGWTIKKILEVMAA